MEIKRKFLYEGQPAFIMLTDDPQAAVEYSKHGICCIGISKEDAFFEGTAFVAESVDEVDDYLLQSAWCRFHHVPFIVFQTQEMFCRESVIDDYDELYRLSEMEEGIEFPPRDVFKAYVENAYHFWGYGVWTVVYRIDGKWETAGWCGILPPREIDGTQTEEMSNYRYGEHNMEEISPELGFVIRKDLRGLGIAKKVCTRILKFASEHLGIDSLVIRTGKDNEAAKALASALGFKKVIPE